MPDTKRRTACKQGGDTCWSGYKKQSMNKKDSKTVRNCVPAKESKRETK
jgi:hypothetical protein